MTLVAADVASPIRLENFQHRLMFLGGGGLESSLPRYETFQGRIGWTETSRVLCAISKLF